MKLFAWIVGSSEVVCIRVFNINISISSKDNFLISRTEFDSGLHSSGNANPIRLMTDGYALIIPTNNSFFFTAITNFKYCMEMKYNKAFTLRMPYLFFSQGVILQMTWITRRLKQGNQALTDHVNATFLLANAYIDPWTMKQAFGNQLFFRVTKDMHRMKPPTADLSIRRCTMQAILEEDRWRMDFEDEEDDENQYHTYGQPLMIEYQNVGPLSAYNRFDE